MATVKTSIIASLPQMFYNHMRSAGYVFRIGLNKDTIGLLSGLPCSSTEVPGCVDAAYEGSIAAGVLTSKFSATFTPSSNASLDRLALAVLRPDVSTQYDLGLIDMSGFTIQLTGGTQYSVSLEHRTTFPTRI